MKRLFLTSTVEQVGVANSIRAKIGGMEPLHTCFLTTPSETPEEASDATMLDNERQMLNDAGFNTFDYTITDKSLSEIESDLQDIHVLHITGGNEFYLKQQSNKCNFGEFVTRFVSRGGVYIGSSCGSIIAGSDMSPTLKLNDISSLTLPIDMTGYGVVDFTVLPHWGSDNFHNLYLTDSLEQIYQEKNQLVVLNDHCYVEIVDDQFRIVDVRSEK